MQNLRTVVHDVRYPAEGLAALSAAGIEYRGYLPNLMAPYSHAQSSLCFLGATTSIRKLTRVDSYNPRMFEAVVRFDLDCAADADNFSILVTIMWPVLTRK